MQLLREGPVDGRSAPAKSPYLLCKLHSPPAPVVLLLALGSDDLRRRLIGKSRVLQPSRQSVQLLCQLVELRFRLCAFPVDIDYATEGHEQSRSAGKQNHCTFTTSVSSRIGHAGWRILGYLAACELLKQLRFFEENSSSLCCGGCSAVCGRKNLCFDPLAGRNRVFRSKLPHRHDRLAHELELRLRGVRRIHRRPAR